MKLELMAGPDGELFYGLEVSVPESIDLSEVLGSYFAVQTDPEQTEVLDPGLRMLAGYVTSQAVSEAMYKHPVMIPETSKTSYMRRLADITNNFGAKLAEFGDVVDPEILLEDDEERAVLQLFAMAYAPDAIPDDARALESAAQSDFRLRDKQQRIDLLATEFMRFSIDSFEFNDNL